MGIDIHHTSIRMSDYVLFALISLPCAGLSATPKLSASDFVGKTVCEVESKWHAYGGYQGFVKDPGFIEFAAITASDDNAYVLVVEKPEKDRCSWRIDAAIEVGKAVSDKKMPPFVTSFNCAVIGKKYDRHVGYFGLIPFGDALEYPHPIDAWSIDMNSMSFSRIRTTNVYCPSFLAD